MNDKTREEFEQWFMSLHGSNIDDLATWGRETSFYREEDYKFVSTRAQFQAWQAAKERYAPKWIDINEKKPELGIPIIISVNGIALCEMYILDRDDKHVHVHWLEPYFHGEGDKRIYIGLGDLIKWMPLPEADL